MNVFNYARALLDVSLERKKIETVVQEMDYLYQGIKGNSYWLTILSSPIPLKEKEAMIKKIGNFDDLVVDFLLVLCKNGVIINFKDIHKEWLRLSDDYRHMAYIRVYSAKRLNETQKKRLEKEIAPYFEGQQMIVDYKIDTKAIGGLRIEYKDTTLDKTIKNILDEMKNVGE